LVGTKLFIFTVKTIDEYTFKKLIFSTLFVAGSFISSFPGSKRAVFQLFAKITLFGRLIKRLPVFEEY
jgi:hypothetical protein